MSDRRRGIGDYINRDTIFVAAATLIMGLAVAATFAFEVHLAVAVAVWIGAGIAVLAVILHLLIPARRSPDGPNSADR